MKRLTALALAGALNLTCGGPSDDGTDSESSETGFADVEPGDLAAQIAGGQSHTCLVLDNDQVVCWGSGSFGALGYGDEDNVGDDEAPATAGRVPAGADAAEVGAGDHHTCVLTTQGRVRCWGESSFGQTGYGNTDAVGDDELPSSVGFVPVGDTVMAVGVGHNHTCAVLDGGTVKCWGRGNNGQLGYGDVEDAGDDETVESLPAIEFPDPVVSVSAGSTHTCAVTMLGEVWCWGSGAFGQLGHGSLENIGDDELPATAGPVAVGATVAQVVAGANHTCARTESGSVRCWGAGAEGRLGYANMEAVGDDELPSEVGDVQLGGVAVDLVAGSAHTCALLDTGSVRCWGSAGALGYGSTENVGDDEFPADVGNVPVGDEIIELAAGDQHTCAILVDQSVRCWGNGQGGRLGYGNEDSVGTNESNPVADAGTVDYR